MLKMQSLVIATDEGYGEYIGKIVGYRNNPAPVYMVKILACVKYPSQNALLIKHVHFKRKPYPYKSVQIFHASNCNPYNGPIPDYEASIKEAYRKYKEVICNCIS